MIPLSIFLALFSDMFDANDSRLIADYDASVRDISGRKYALGTPFQSTYPCARVARTRETGSNSTVNGFESRGRVGAQPMCRGCLKLSSLPVVKIARCASLRALGKVSSSGRADAIPGKFEPIPRTQLHRDMMFVAAATH